MLLLLLLLSERVFMTVGDNPLTLALLMAPSRKLTRSNVWLIIRGGREQEKENRKGGGGWGGGNREMPLPPLPHPVLFTNVLNYRRNCCCPFGFAAASLFGHLMVSLDGGGGRAISDNTSDRDPTLSLMDIDGLSRGMEKNLHFSSKDKYWKSNALESTIEWRPMMMSKQLLMDGKKDIYIWMH